MSDKILAPEVQALIEKINSLESCDSSYQRAKRLYESGDFTQSERDALNVALRAVKRRETLIEAMRIVINDREITTEVTVRGLGDPFLTQPTNMVITSAQLEIAKELAR